MWNWIPTNDNYLIEYHAALSDLVDVINSGGFKEEAGRVRELILPYIEKDPKAYYTPKEFEKAYETLLDFTELRAESVRKQVEGQLAATSEMQAEEDKVDASSISIKDMGTLEDLEK